MKLVRSLVWRDKFNNDVKVIKVYFIFKMIIFIIYDDNDDDDDIYYSKTYNNTFSIIEWVRNKTKHYITTINEKYNYIYI